MWQIQCIGLAKKFVQMLQENQNELFDQANIWVSAFDKDSWNQIMVWEAQERGDICIIITDLCCSAEANTTL